MRLSLEGPGYFPTKCVVGWWTLQQAYIAQWETMNLSVLLENCLAQLSPHMGMETMFAIVVIRTCLHRAWLKQKGQQSPSHKRRPMVDQMLALPRQDPWKQRGVRDGTDPQHRSLQAVGSYCSTYAKCTNLIKRLFVCQSPCGRKSSLCTTHSMSSRKNNSMQVWVRAFRHARSCRSLLSNMQVCINLSDGNAWLIFLFIGCISTWWWL